MIKIIFSDFDETLIDYHNNYSFTKYSLNVLKKINDKGIIFCIVTGRHISFFEKFQELSLYVDYIISSNGAEIYDVKNKKVLYKNSLSMSSSSDVINYCISNGIDYYVNSGINRLFNSFINYDDINQLVLKYDEIMDFKIKKHMGNINDIKISNYVNREKKVSLDLTNITVSKGRGIYYLCNLLNIFLSDAICFGDSKNDLSMFNIIDKSFCVENGTSELKKMALKVIDNCHNDGVFSYIDNNIL